MDLNYLVNELLPQRKKEIKQGKNLSTRQPIYVVLDLYENICSGHTDYPMTVNYKCIEPKHGYIDENSEEPVFKLTDKGMVSPAEVTQFFTDRICAFFLTSNAAYEYLKYQKHNMNKPYVYVFYSGYANREMDLLLNNE